MSAAGLAVVQALEAVMDRMALDAKAPSAQPGSDIDQVIPDSRSWHDRGDARAWEVSLGPGLQAELMLTRTSDDDHLLSLVVAVDVANDPTRWHTLDAFGQTVSTLARPVRMLRRDSELGSMVQARAQHPDALAELLVELVVLTRRTTALILQPWVALARGDIDFDTAILRVAASVQPMPAEDPVREGAAR